MMARVLENHIIQLLQTRVSPGAFSAADDIIHLTIYKDANIS